MSDLLRPLREATRVPDADPEREQLLFEAFDANVERRARRARRERWFSSASSARSAFKAFAALATAAAIVLAVVIRSAPPRVDPLGATEFVLWPGASALPTFESGHLMRVDLPAPMAIDLGLVPPPSVDGVAHAEVLVGQDGLPRAIRLANDF